MNILVCLDDTDNLESRGTGELASLLADRIVERGWGQSSFITRHQLLVHPDIPYTSHNSAMCFGAALNDSCPPARFIEYAAGFLERESAPGSDPGLCVATLAELADSEPILAFGRAAKREVLNKKDAYSLAEKTGIHLSEHGGDGGGGIGALAGVGLRLGGNDGRLKGRLKLGNPGEVRTVFALKNHPLIDTIRSLDGAFPVARDNVELGDKIKTVLLEGKSILLLERTGDPAVPWRTCSRQALRNY